MVYPNSRNPLPSTVSAVGRVISRAGAAPGFGRYASGKIVADAEFERVFGTADEFLTRYENFQSLYRRALDTGLDTSKAAGVDIEFLRAGGKIDLSILRKDVARELEQKFRDDVLRLGNLFGGRGIPNIELPSANLYRRLFRYEVDTSRSASGAMHPLMAVLNRTLFNVNPDAMGLDAFNVGVSNLMGLQQLRQVAGQDVSSLLGGVGPTGAPKVVRTFDVETTGIFRGAQTRSMGQVDMVAGDISRRSNRFYNKLCFRTNGWLNCNPKGWSNKNC